MRTIGEGFVGKVEAAAKARRILVAVGIALCDPIGHPVYRRELDRSRRVVVIAAVGRQRVEVEGVLFEIGEKHRTVPAVDV